MVDAHGYTLSKHEEDFDKIVNNKFSHLLFL